jgi:superfamily I DNA and RNA helicase
LVCAHAVGFGIYGKMVQMLENEEHWNDVGYVLTGGQLRPGDKVELLRPAENSLGTLSEKQTIDELVSAASYDSFDEEVAATVRSIRQDLKDGLRPDDIVVTVVDDRNAKAYLGLIATKLQNYSIRSNNIHGAMGLVDFQRDDHVTLTTVHKAKGNEGFVVYVVGASAASAVPGKQNRNKLFTAMTRAKGWLRVSGVGSAANALAKEIELAKRNFPSLRFVYPKKSDLAIMKRDLDDEAVLSQEAERLLDKLSDDQLAFYLKQRRQPKKR